MPAATVKPLLIEQGATFTKHYAWKVGVTPVDLSGCTARMQIRECEDSDTVLVSLTTENGRIALGGAAGTIDLTLTAADTAAMTWFEGVFDLEIDHGGGVVTRLLKGRAMLSKEITRE